MNKKALKRTAIAAVCTSFMLASAGAVSAADIKKDINEATAKCEAAHQLAESARALGVDENHYTIWYAKKLWAEHNEDVVALTKEYNKALAEEKAAKEQNEKGTLIGQFKCTYYTGSADEGGNITALGTPVTPWYTVAVDPRVIPLGTKLRIEGYNGIFVAQDTGTAIKRNTLDIAVNSKSEANRLGVQYRKVYIVK